jgi:betaine-aldehyde dehydrogenase
MAAPELDAIAPDVQTSSRMLIGGDLRGASSGKTIEAVNPATEAVVGAVPDATAEDVDDVVAAASAAAPGWRDTSWASRAALLRDLADLLDAHRDELALLDAIDAGLPVKSMRADVSSAAAEVRYFAGLAGETKGRTIPSGPNALTLTEFVPYSVVARIVPFNHPLKFAIGKSAAPLAAGCAVVVKPGEYSSLSALRMAELTQELFPPGVFNVITGRGSVAGAALASHPGVPRVAFTGSVPTGRRIMELGAPNVKHVSLELGGKNPFIVFPDADPVAAARGAVAAMNFARSMGQSCGSTSRALVHESVYDEFVEALVDGVAALRIGDPMDDSTDMGPLAFRSHYEKVTGLIAVGVEEGATLRYGGRRPAGFDRGFYLEPAVFTDVHQGMRIANEEIFGPVIAVMRWSDEDEMIDVANATEFGLTGNIWTKDITRALRTARRVQSGYISVNGTGKRPTGAPFGGFKLSGIGKESSLDELLSYGREQSITVTL